MSTRARRTDERFKRRLETEFSAEGKTYRAISSDLSTSGLFIRTNHAFAPGTVIDITLHLPDGTTSKLKARVMRAFQTHGMALKNGMGVLLIEKDVHYINFMKSYIPDFSEKPTTSDIKSEIKSESRTKAETGSKPEPEADKETQKTADTTSSDADFLVLSCAKCGVKNKVRRSKIAQGPKCGKCKSPLAIPMA